MQHFASNSVHTEFHFSALRRGDYVLWAELWFVVVCWCAIIKKYSENCFDVGIIVVDISRASPTTTVLPFLYSWRLRGFCREFLYGTVLKMEVIQVRILDGSHWGSTGNDTKTRTAVWQRWCSGQICDKNRILWQQCLMPTFLGLKSGAWNNGIPTTTASR